MRSIVSFTFFTLLFLTSCKQSGTESSTAGGPKLQVGSCNIGKWNNAFLPLNVKISPDFVGDFNNADQVSGLNLIEQMVKTWNDALAPGVNLFQLPMGTTAATGSSSLSNFRDNELGIYKSHTWFSNVSANALAITQFYGIVRSDGSLGTYIDLTHADIILNYRDFGSVFSMNANSFTDYDIPTILLHEMGHFLGLCHEGYQSSIMAPYYISTQRSLRTFDTNKIRALYLNNQNYNSFSSLSALKSNAITKIDGTEVSGIIELSANGHCRHLINGKLVHEHD